jgi:AcrR family transcriptional regulator
MTARPSDHAPADSETAGADARRTAKGRPRSAEASRGILRAVVDLIAEERSIGAVTVEAVAERSGVSKATIYRRWSSREELIGAAVDSIKADLDYELPHTSVRDDLMTIAKKIRKDFDPREQVVLEAMNLELRSNPKLKAVHDRLHERRRALVRNVFELGVERGEIRSDADLELAVPMLVAPILTIMVYGNYQELNTPDLAEKVIDHLLGGLAVR